MRRATSKPRSEPERAEMTRAEFAAVMHQAVDDWLALLPEQARFADARPLHITRRGEWKPTLYWTQWFIGPLAEVWMPNEYYAGPR